MSAGDIRNLADAWAFFRDGLDDDLSDVAVEAMRIAFYSGACSLSQLSARIMAQPMEPSTRYALLDNLQREANAVVDEWRT